MQEASHLPQPSIVDLDPEDPSQLLDDAGQFSIVDVDLDREAQPHAEADAELDAAVALSAGEIGMGEPGIEGGLDEDDEDDSEIDDDARELDTPDQTTADAYADSEGDTGNLYGINVPRTGGSVDQAPDRETFEDAQLGEHMFETIQKKMAENGTADPEEDVEFEDDSEGHSRTDRRDRPIADKGSGGPGGL